MNRYEEALLKNASRLDADIEACSELAGFASMVVKEKDRAATIKILKTISEVVEHPDYKIEIKKKAQDLNTSLIEFYGFTAMQEICRGQEEPEDDPRTLKELLEDLNELIGLTNVKSKVHDLIVYQKVLQMRQDKNLHSSKNTLHLAFTGKPGTGKTTVARIVGRIYKRIGLLSKGHFIEVSRTDLIAGYQGQTALKVKEVIERAKGGVLFIDEAYSITENDHSDSYGRECLTELTKALEDYRDDLVVIVAGYTEPMKKFFDSNPGLRSRFNTFIEFDDYTSVELSEMLDFICRKNDYVLSGQLKERIRVYFDEQIALKDENFANGRLVRNLYDDLVMNHAKRVIKITEPSVEELSAIISEDFECIVADYCQTGICTSD